MTTGYINSLEVADVEELLSSRLEAKELEASQENLEAELVLYKEEELAEIERQKALAKKHSDAKKRISQLLVNPHGFFHEVVADTPNPAAYLRDRLAETDFEDGDSEAALLQLLSQLEAAQRVHEDALSAQQELDELAQMRADRDKYLADTDYTMLADAPYSTAQKAEYREYRQYLRDLPSLYANQQILEAEALTFAEWKNNKPVY